MNFHTSGNPPTGSDIAKVTSVFSDMLLPASIREISAQEYQKFSEAIQSQDKKSNISIFETKTTAPTDFVTATDKYFCVQLPGQQTVIFALNTADPKLPFYRFVRPQFSYPRRSPVIGLVQEIIFTEGANLELALDKLMSEVCQTGGSLAFCFSADCLQLAQALENSNSMCLHISQEPSEGVDAKSLSSFFFSFVAQSSGYDSTIRQDFTVANRIALLRIDQHFEYDPAKLEQFVAEEIKKVASIWNQQGTKDYLKKTREQLGINQPEHQHLEIGAGLFPDFKELLLDLAPTGAISIFERERVLLDTFRQKSTKDVHWSRFKLVENIDIASKTMRPLRTRFDSIRIVDFFEFITQDNLEIIAANILELLKPGGRLVIAEKNLSTLKVSDADINIDCDKFRSLFGLSCDSGPGGNLEQTFCNVGFTISSNQTTLTRKFNGKDLATFLPWTRIDNFHTYARSKIGKTANDLVYQMDIQQLVFTKPE